MPTPHKHAEVIKAWADGEEIEFYSEQTKTWQRPRRTAPAWHNTIKYRVKPKPIELWLNIYPDTSWGKIFKSREDADRNASISRIACVKVDYFEGEGL